jgi:ABC-type branched-subunit amino acid transport system permease subunit
LYVLGAIFILVTIFLPKGVVGLLESKQARDKADAMPEAKPA